MSIDGLDEETSPAFLKNDPAEDTESSETCPAMPAAVRGSLKTIRQRILKDGLRRNNADKRRGSLKTIRQRILKVDLFGLERGHVVRFLKNDPAEDTESY